MLARITNRLVLEIEEVDVDADEELLRSFDHSVPVVRTQSGKVLAAGRWTETGLVSSLIRHRLTGA